MKLLNFNRSIEKAIVAECSAVAGCVNSLMHCDKCRYEIICRKGFSLTRKFDCVIRVVRESTTHFHVIGHYMIENRKYSVLCDVSFVSETQGTEQITVKESVNKLC